MCGFVGVLSNSGQASLKIDQQFKKMNNIIFHRGPDDSGYYADQYIQLGFRRLSIIDLEAGHQPLSYEDQRYWIVFNGEIYNYIELRNELEKDGYVFKTSSDTEVLLALYSQRKEKMLYSLRGMFSFLIWDREKNELFGARDPFGIKPLYYLELEDKFYFASERKSIVVGTDHELINEESLHHYFTFQYVPEPSTMSRGMMKMEPGHYFLKKQDEGLTIKCYWKPVFKPVTDHFTKLKNELQQTLLESVSMHMRSDVPVGSFLSGGIDSSFIVSLARQLNPNFKTFSVGFATNGYSEIDIAKETAHALNVENISYLIQPEEFIKALPKIVWFLDDPLADPSAVPLYFVAREASKHVKVVLSGEGADELFGGYNIYREPIDLRVFDRVPQPIKTSMKMFARFLPDGMKGKSFIERGCTPYEDRYIGNAKIFNANEIKQLIKMYWDNVSFKDVTLPFYQEAKNYDKVTTMQHIDIQTWLKGDILLKADKMTMANSIELRVPFLDKEVFHLASKIPTDMKIANNTTKYILRKAAEGIVPEHVLNRKKLGFPVPIRSWFKNELYDWALKVIQESETDYFINKGYVIYLLSEHCAGKKDNSRKLWTVLIFMIWHQVFIEKKYCFYEDTLNENIEAEY
ncbi:asparagine synthase [Bacillus sp. SA1-12]|uniref:asparagine synthase (glutamine-hydrolyzing) n=1 Tax=Bacillus sp. SA1-12 TaxID=1455638 RepID=UPI000626FCF2|nr:asparagine synthase (glutamine-hydrolyzing) [Bacillus sp. SA1-12]KKI89713.1 asparagine synthase [Bacillus sp. SA1-12]